MQLYALFPIGHHTKSFMRNACLKLSFIALVLFYFAALAEPVPSIVTALPGQKADGSVLLPNQWSLRPVGKQVPLGDFPVNIAVHPDGRYAAVMHSGHGPHEIIVVDLAEARGVSRTRLREAYYGLEFARGGG